MSDKCWKRAAWKSLGFALLLAAASGVQGQQPWTLVGIGDTQVLVQSTAGGEAFRNMTQWAVDNREGKNIAFVTQLGDIVQNGLYGRPNVQAPSAGNTVEWQRAELAMSLLEDASIPWGTAVGNHELDWVDVVPGVVPSSSWWNHRESGDVPASGFKGWKQRFGPATSGRFEDVPAFGGASPDDIDSFFVYQAGGRDYLHLHLQLDVPDTAIAWAQEVIDAHQGMPTIISTHVFEGTAHGPPNNPYLPGPGRNSANQIWDKLIKNNAQIFLVLNGHTGQQAHQSRVNAAGQPVFTIVQDYAGHDGGGKNAGYMRLYEFDETNSVIRVKTYSPTLDSYLTGGAHQFELPLNWLTRFDVGVLGDLNFDMVIDRHDWNLFAAGHLKNLAGLSPTQQYTLGDLNGDGVNDVADFTLFKQAFDVANGAGQFQAMASSVPEPATVGLAVAGTCWPLLRYGRRHFRATSSHTMSSPGVCTPPAATGCKSSPLSF